MNKPDIFIQKKRRDILKAAYLQETTTGFIPFVKLLWIKTPGKKKLSIKVLPEQKIAGFKELFVINLNYVQYTIGKLAIAKR